jgi:hypothetical protein
VEAEKNQLSKPQKVLFTLQVAQNEQAKSNRDAGFPIASHF